MSLELKSVLLTLWWASESPGGGVVKNSHLGSTLSRTYDRAALRECISNKLPGDAAAGPETIQESHSFQCFYHFSPLGL